MVLMNPSAGQQWRLRQYSDNLEGWDGMGDEREVQEGGDRCIPMADSCRCMAETNIIE